MTDAELVRELRHDALTMINHIRVSATNAEDGVSCDRRTFYDILKRLRQAANRIEQLDEKMLARTMQALIDEVRGVMPMGK